MQSQYHVAPKQNDGSTYCPRLAHTLSISIKQMQDHRAKVLFNDIACRVYVKEKLVWIGQREPTTSLWYSHFNQTAHVIQLLHPKTLNLYNIQPTAPTP